MIKNVIIAVLLSIAIPLNAGIAETLMGWMNGGSKMVSDNPYSTALGLGSLVGAATYFGIRNENFEKFNEILRELDDQKIPLVGLREIKKNVDLTKDTSPLVDLAVNEYDKAVREKKPAEGAEKKLRDAIANEKTLWYRIPKFVACTLTCGGLFAFWLGVYKYFAKK